MRDSHLFIYFPPRSIVTIQLSKDLAGVTAEQMKKIVIARATAAPWRISRSFLNTRSKARETSKCPREENEKRRACVLFSLSSFRHPLSLSLSLSCQGGRERERKRDTSLVSESFKKRRLSPKLGEEPFQRLNHTI